MPTSREKLVDAAVDLILSRGYHATTVDEICEKAGVAKGSFYYAFDSKEDLGVAALEYFTAEHEEAFVSSGFMEAETPEEALFVFLDFLVAEGNNLWNRGCLLGNMALEISDDLPSIRSRLAELFEQVAVQIEQLLAPYLDSIQRPGLPSAREYSDKLAVQIEGALVMARATGDSEILTRMLSLYRDELRALKET